MKSLVIYSSRTGNTKALAQVVYDALRGEKELVSINAVSQLNAGYDLIAVGFPVMAGKVEPRAKKLLEKGAASGTLVWALNQSQGRGRLGKKWVSAAGKGLYLSFIVRPEIDFSEYAKITLVAGVATARFLKEELNDAREKLALKWPNDLLVDGRKIAGILAEATAPTETQQSAIIIGIGVNISHKREDFPKEIGTQATSLFLETSKKMALQPLVRDLQKNIQSTVTDFESGLFPQLLHEWRSMDYLYGKEIDCVGLDGKILSGKALGPDNTGALFIEDCSGNRHEILSGDLRLAGKTTARREQEL